MNKVYNMANSLAAEVAGLVREKHNVKVYGSCEVKGFLVVFGFATDHKAVKLCYLVSEIENGVSPITVMRLLEDAFQL